jgi:hypothetical protein
MSLFELYDPLKPSLERIEHLERYKSKGKLPAPIVDYLDK